MFVKKEKLIRISKLYLLSTIDLYAQDWPPSLPPIYQLYRVSDKIVDFFQYNSLHYQSDEKITNSHRSSKKTFTLLFYCCQFWHPIKNLVTLLFDNLPIFLPLLEMGHHYILQLNHRYQCHLFFWSPCKVTCNLKMVAGKNQLEFSIIQAWVVVSQI